jgi:hypothetical protein
MLSDIFKKLLASRDTSAAECALALLRDACSGEPGAAPAARKLFRAHPRLAAAMVQPAFAALHTARADRSSSTATTSSALTSLVCDIVAAASEVALPASDPAPLVAFLSRVDPPSAASLGALETLSAADARCDCVAVARHLARALKRDGLSKALRSKALRVLVAVLEDVDRPLPAELGRELGAAAAELLDSDAGSMLVAGNTAALATLISAPGVVAPAQLLLRLDSKLELGSRNAPLTVGRLARDALWCGLCAPGAGADAAPAAVAAPARIVAARLCALLRSAEDLESRSVPHRGFAPSVLGSVFVSVDAVQEHGVSAPSTGGARGPLRSIATLFSSGGAPPIAAAALVSELVQLAEADHDGQCTALKLLTVALPYAPGTLRAVELRTWLAQRCDALVRTPTAATHAPPLPQHALELLLQLAQRATMAAAALPASDSAARDEGARHPFRDWLDRHAVELLLRPGIDDGSAAALCAMLVRGGPARTRTLFGALAALSSNTADSAKLLRLLQLLGHVAAASRSFITADEAQRAQRGASDTARPGADEYQGFETKQERVRHRSSLRLARCVRTSFISPYIPLIIRLALGSEDIVTPAAAGAAAAAAAAEVAALPPAPAVVPAVLRCTALHTLAALMLMSPELITLSVPRIVSLTQCSGGTVNAPPQSSSPQATAARDDVAVSAVFLCGAILRADAERESQRAAVEALTARLSDGSAPVCCAALAVLGNLLVSKQVQPAAVLPRIAAATVRASIGALATALIRQLLRREGKLASRLLFDIYCGLASIDSGGSAGSRAGGSCTGGGVDTLAVMRHILAVAKAARVDARDLALPLLHTLLDESGMGRSVRAPTGRLLSASPLARSAAATLRLLPPAQSAATWKALSSLTNVWRTGTGGLQGIGVAVERGVAGDINAYCRAASGRATAEKRDEVLRALSMLPVA